MERKYELLKDDTINVHGRTLYRIKALRDFGNVKAGDLGGYIEKEDNLSHKGKCWVSGNAKVYGHAVVCDDAVVCGNALVYDNAWVGCIAKVYGDAWVHGNAHVYDETQVCGNAEVCDDARVSGNAKISDNACIHSANDYIYIGPIGSRDDYITFYLTEDKNIMVKCGYFNDTLEEFIKAVNDTYKNNEKYKKQYQDTIKYVVEYLKGDKEDNNMKALKVEMTVMVKDDKYTDVIKQWEHHIDYAINMDEYPEIDHIEDVKVMEMSSDVNTIAKKYVFLDDDTIIINNHVLHRIKAIRDFGDVKAGDLGGYIEDGGNLSHEGDCWVYDNASVFDLSVVDGNASVAGTAKVFGNTMVYDNALIAGDKTEVHDACICKDGQVFSSRDYMTFFDDSIIPVTFYRTATGINVKCHCFIGSIDDFTNAVNDTFYLKNLRDEREKYLKAIDIAKHNLM